MEIVVAVGAAASGSMSARAIAVAVPSSARLTISAYAVSARAKTPNSPGETMRATMAIKAILENRSISVLPADQAAPRHTSRVSAAVRIPDGRPVRARDAVSGCPSG